MGIVRKWSPPSHPTIIAQISRKLTTMCKQTYEYAVRYLDAGLSPIPINKKPGDIDACKKPYGKWKRYQESPAEPRELEHWFNNGKDLNVALLGGSVSGNVVWIDFDDKESYRSWAYQYPLKAPTQRTKKGYHVGVRLDRQPPGNKDIFFEGNHVGETRGEGGYIIAAPSLHGSGHTYNWVIPPWDIEWPVIKSLEVLGLTTNPVPKKDQKKIAIPDLDGGRSRQVNTTIENMLMLLASSRVDQNRNTNLNKVAYTLGGIVGAGHLDRIEAERMMTNVALAIGLGEKETAKTIKSGLDAGIRFPLIGHPSEGIPELEPLEDVDIIVSALADLPDYFEVTHIPVNDQALIIKARSHSWGGDKFKRLWAGDWTGYDSKSEAQMSLCRQLAYWTGRDIQRMDRLFRRSKFFKDPETRAKWVKPSNAAKETYGLLQMTLACLSCNKVFSVSRKGDDQWTQI